MGADRVGIGFVGGLPDDVRFAFQPLYSLHTGGIVAFEALARPAVGSIGDVLAQAWRHGRLPHVDVGLAAAAAVVEAAHETLLPLHLNITAFTTAEPVSAFAPLLEVLSRTGRRPREVVLEISPPFQPVAPSALLAGMHRLADQGFRLAFDGLGASDLPLNLLTEARIDLVKLDRTTLRRIPGDRAAVAIVEALVHFAARTELRLVATGIESRAQLETARRLGVRIAQGDLFTPAGLGALANAVTPAIPEPADETDPVSLAPSALPRVEEFLRPATTVHSAATCEEVRTVLLESEAGGIIGVDAQGHPQWSVDRTRFLLAVTGPYGHALHANRPAVRLSDPPRTIRHGARALDLLHLVRDADWSRTGEDVVLVDHDGRYQGVVMVAEIVRAMAEVKIEEAAALNPLTRLPGSDLVAREVDRRITGGEAFAVAWLDVDSFKKVNDTVGFAAGDDLIRALGRTLTDLTASVRRLRVSHVGGDDFLVTCDVDDIDAIAGSLLNRYWSAEGMPVTVSLASLTCARQAVQSYRHVSRLLAPLKKHAKDIAGSSWVNSTPDSGRVEVRHGQPSR